MQRTEIEVEHHRHLAEVFFPGTAASYDRVVHWFTLRLDFYWKRAMFHPIRKAERILDLGCGTGIVTLGLAKRFPGAEFTGIDITRDYLSIYEKRVKDAGIRASARLGNVEEVELEGLYDVVVSSYVPKYVDCERLLVNLCSHMHEGGLLVLHDFALPQNVLARTVWEVYNGLMNRIGLWLFPEWREVFSEKLTCLIRETRWFHDFKTALPKHGFDILQARSLTLGSAALLVARRTGAEFPR